MSGKSEEIVELLSPTVQALGMELLGIEYAASGSSALLRLYIDVADRPVNVEDCEAVSREVSAVLDVEDPITSNYTLEVSSPGIDRPLFTLAHFARFAGEQAKVNLRLPQDGRRRLQGKILRTEAGRVVLAEDNGNEFTVSIDNIEKARLVPDYAALGIAAAKPLPGQGKVKPAGPGGKNARAGGKRKKPTDSDKN